MQRREFLTMQAATVVAGMLPAALLGKEPSAQAAASPVPMSLDIIDCHTHFYDPSRPQGVPWPGKGSELYRTVLPRHLRELPQFRPVTGTVIVEASAWVEDNAWLLELAEQDPFIVGIVGNLSPGEEGFAEHVQRFAQNPLYRGIRVSSKRVSSLLDGDLVDLKQLAEHDLSLDINGGPDTPGIAAELAKRLKELRIIINHIGNVSITSDPPPDAWQAGIEAAAKFPNVACKVSALVEGAFKTGQQTPESLDFYRPYIDVVWNAFGDDRVIYGSNWPVSERAADYLLLQRLALEYAASRGEGVVQKFCATNAKQFYKWVEREGRVKG